LNKKNPPNGGFFRFGGNATRLQYSWLAAPQYGEIVPNKPTAIANNKKPIKESPSLPMSVSC
ncbi:hypothetical protein, partial [Pseudomonas syringae]|uniref:hypothetical protein n=1 Tax=Pseudomonas syringae TaxID=317 RepID=UPI001966EACA